MYCLGEYRDKNLALFPYIEVRFSYKEIQKSFSKLYIEWNAIVRLKKYKNDLSKTLTKLYIYSFNKMYGAVVLD